MAVTSPSTSFSLTGLILGSPEAALGEVPAAFTVGARPSPCLSCCCTQHPACGPGDPPSSAVLRATALSGCLPASHPHRFLDFFPTSLREFLPHLRITDGIPHVPLTSAPSLPFSLSNFLEVTSSFAVFASRPLFTSQSTQILPPLSSRRSVLSLLRLVLPGFSPTQSRHLVPDPL